MGYLVSPFVRKTEKKSSCYVMGKQIPFAPWPPNETKDSFSFCIYATLFSNWCITKSELSNLCVCVCVKENLLQSPSNLACVNALLFRKRSVHSKPNRDPGKRKLLCLRVVALAEDTLFGRIWNVAKAPHGSVTRKHLISVYRFHDSLGFGLFLLP